MNAELIRKARAAIARSNQTGGGLPVGVFDQITDALEAADARQVEGLASVIALGDYLAKHYPSDETDIAAAALATITDIEKAAVAAARRRKPKPASE